MSKEIRDLKKNISELREEIATSSPRRDGKFFMVANLYELRMAEDLLRKKMQEMHKLEVVRMRKCDEVILREDKASEKKKRENTRRCLHKEISRL